MIDKKLISIFLIFIVIISSIIFILLFLLSPVNINPIDNTPPSVEIESPKNLKYNTTTQLLNISASDDIEVDTIWYNWDNINTTYTSEEYILFNEGSNTLYAYANDSTGNIGMTLVTFIIDIISPILQIISPLNTTYNTATQLLNISASDNNEIDIIWYNWNGTEIIYNSPHSILFNEGLNTIYAYANDSAGNIEMTSVTFTIDTISPILQINSPLNKTYYSAKQLLNITVSNNNEIDTIWYNWNGTEIIYNSPHSILFNEGLNTIYAYANDSAGNIGITSVTFTIYIIDHNLTFISVWNTTLMSTSSSSSNQVKLPLESSGNYDFLVDWGDGNNNTITSWNQLEVTHTYASEGVYTIRIDGTLIGWRFNDGGDKLKLLEIQQWGILRLGNSMCYFTGCTNLNLTTNDSLNLKGTTSLGLAFTNCTNIGSTGNLNSWDVSKVIDMYAMFWGATSFNQNIHNWSVSNVQDMGGMFAGASSFNQPIDNWNVSSVIYMGGMFQNANSFNQDIHNWSVSNVQYMSDMFQNANSFNQIIGDWNVSRVIYMDYMFAGASSFNQSIGNWDVSSVIRMDGMFSYATSFDQYIGDWNVSRVTNMYYMFSFASSFNQDISNWNISLVTDMGCMFQFATSFNQSIGNWDVSSVTDMSYMFSNAHSFDQDISNWNVCLVANMASMLTYTALSTTNYDKLLIGWWSLPSLQSGVTLDVGTKKYSASAATARLNIINTYGWTINDGGQI